MSEDLVSWHHRILSRRGLVVSKDEIRAQHRVDPAEAARLDALRLSGKPTYSRAEMRRAEEEGRQPVPDNQGRRLVDYQRPAYRKRRTAA